jgi:hypothetical protein
MEIYGIKNIFYTEAVKIQEAEYVRYICAISLSYFAKLN